MLYWRLVPEARRSASFSGQGSREYGGRWNPKGTSVVYLAEHLSLAALETYVHLPKASLAKPYLAYRVSVPDSVPVQRVQDQQLPPNWRMSPVPSETQAIGLQWLESEESLLLSVPSVIVPSERNLVLNIEHPHWSLATLAEPDLFFFDPRMWQKP